MTRTSAIAVSCCVAALAGCGHGSPEKEAARRAFERLATALDAADPAALWDISDDATHKFFDGLVVQVHEAVALVDSHYPEADRPAARAAVGAALIGPMTTGRALFAEVLDPQKLAVARDESSREVDVVEVQGDHARVVTRSGAAVEFTKEADGEFRTSMFLHAFQELPAAGTLRDNIAAVRKVAVGKAGPTETGAATGVEK